MELLIVYSLLGLATILVFYRTRFASRDEMKKTTRREVIKFRIPPTVADKETQTQTEAPVPVCDSPMSLSSDSLFFDFDEDYYGDGE